MKSNRRSCIPFFVSLLISLISLFAIFVVFVNMVCRGISIKEPWLPYVYWVKSIIAERTNSPKIVLLGGSATLFSVDSEVVEKMCGLPVVNLGLHAGLPFSFYPDYVRRCVSSNDIVVAALEPHHHYSEKADKIFSDLSLNMLLGIAPEFQRALSIGQLFDLYFGYGCKYLDTLMSKKDRVRLRKDDVLKVWASSKESGPRFGYDLCYVNAHGDMLMPLGQKSLLTYKGGQYATKLSTDFLNSYDRLRSKIVEKHARLLLTCSNSLYYPQLCRDLDRLKIELQKRDICLFGQVETFNFPDVYYYDTQYHMNAVGAAMYSRELAKTICRFMGREYPLDSDEQMISFLEHPERISAPGILSRFSHGIRTTNRCFSVRLSRPRCLDGKDWSCEFLVDRGGAKGRIVNGISLAAKGIPFQEVVYRSKNLIRICLPDSLSKAVLDFEVKPSVYTGLERVFIDDAEMYGRFTFMRRDIRVRYKEGMSVPGTRGAWTDGDVAVIEFVVYDRAICKDGRYEMEFVVVPISGEQVVECFSGGERLAVWTFTGTGQQIKRIEVPTKSVRNGVATIEFRIGKTVCPKEFGQGNDKRHLGIRFISARILE